MSGALFSFAVHVYARSAGVDALLVRMARMDTAAELESGSDSGHDKEQASTSPVHHMSLWPPPRSTRHSGRRRRQLTVLGIVLSALLLVVGGGAAIWVFVPVSEEDMGGQEVSLDDYEGSWSGRMHQVDTEGEPVAEWEAQVRIEKDAERGSTAWTTFSCSGTLDLSAREGDRFVYDYTETSDPENRCVDESELTIWLAEDGLNAEWVSITAEGTRMVSTGVLD